MLIDNKTNYLKFNKHGDIEINLVDCYELYYITMKNNMSVTCADEMITSFYNRTAMRHIGKDIEIPTYKTIKNVIEKYLANLVPLYKFKYHLPKELFGSKYKVFLN